jgi:photosystem II stability/assembly factor-like uncharacterized protein
MSRPILVTLVFALLVPFFSAAEPAELPEDFFAELEFRHLGPAGNRVTAVAGVAGDPKVYFAGAASGGVFRSADGGVHWEPVFDSTGAFSIGSIAVAPSDPNVVWVGTGETFIRSNVTLGDGIYRSTDGGRTWERRGLEKSGRIGRLAIHPQNPDVVFAAALGHAYGPQPERGLYRTKDGGTTWQQVLFVGEEAGAIDVVMDTNNPRILFAATWQLAISTTGRISGGPGSGIFQSTDGGETWRRLEGKGLPRGPWGKVGLAMSAADSQRVYALIETSSNRDFAPVGQFQGVLWRSDDGGGRWQMVNADNTLTQRPLYYTRAVAAPDDADEVTFLATQQSLSKDGGRTIEEQNSGFDHHDLWIDPQDPDRRISGHDGGVSITVNRGKTWYRPQLPNAQIYRVATDDRIPYWVYGNRQDGATAAGPSNTATGEAEIPLGAWRAVGGCEVGSALPDLHDPDIVWSGCYDGWLDRFDWRSGLARDVSVWPLAVEGWGATDLELRFQWQAPLALSPHAPDTAYYGTQFVHRSRDGGKSWETISPELTTANPELMGRQGGLTLDDAGPTIAPVVFALAESSREPGVIWAGTNDGQVQVTRDGGTNWENVTRGLRGLPARGTVGNVEPSRHADGRAYLTVDRHQEGDTAPYVYRTTDYGRSWTSLRGNLPGGVYGTAHCVREDPEVPGLLYLGTEDAVWVSFDDGRRWHHLRSNLPPVPVAWLTVQERFADLVLATYGRGFWVLDDVTPLRRLARGLGEGPELLAARPAYRLREREPWWSEPYSAAAGRNPKFGAILHYRLPAKVEEPVALRVRDTTGRLLRTLPDLPQAAGLHRLVWDLEDERTPEVRLRTKPLENARFQMPEAGFRPLVDGGRYGLLAPPGSYTLELAIGERIAGTATLDVLPDPTSGGTPESLAKQMEVLRPLVAAIGEAATTINRIEWLRKQAADLEESFGETAPAGARAGSALPAAVDALRAELEALEGHFFDLRLTSASQDTLRWPRLLYARLTALAQKIGKSDLAPTEPQRAVAGLLLDELAARGADLDRLLAEDVPAVNALAAETGLAILATE